MTIHQHPLVEDLGSLAVKDESLCYDSNFYPSWKVPLAEIVLIGEYTNEDGPHASDHFLVLLTKGEHVYECPVDASGFAESFRKVSESFKQQLKVELMFETRIKSRIIWPPSLHGRDLYVVEPDTSTLWNRVLHFLRCGSVRLKLNPHATAIAK